MLDNVLMHSSVFLLIFIRCFTMLLTLPLFSMRVVSGVTKVALSGYMAFIMFNTVDFSLYSTFLFNDEVFSLHFVLIALGEGLIGVLMGFYISIIFAAFSTSGQLTAF